MLFRISVFLSILPTEGKTTGHASIYITSKSVPRLLVLQAAPNGRKEFGIWTDVLSGSKPSQVSLDSHKSFSRGYLLAYYNIFRSLDTFSWKGDLRFSGWMSPHTIQVPLDR